VRSGRNPLVGSGKKIGVLAMSKNSERKARRYGISIEEQAWKCVDRAHARAYEHIALYGFRPFRGNRDSLESPFKAEKWTEIKKPVYTMEKAG